MSDQKKPRLPIGEGTLTFDDLLRLKAANQETLAVSREEFREQMKGMSPDERDRIEDRFYREFSKIAAQFGRSRRFIPQKYE